MLGFVFLIDEKAQAKAYAMRFVSTVLNKRLATYAAISIVALLFVCVAAFAEKELPSKPIDLNVANVKELQQLPGIGAVTAQRILDMRQKSGHFHRVEDLLAIRGISRKKLDALRPYVTVSAIPASPTPAQKNSPGLPKK